MKPCSYIDPTAPVIPWSATLTDQGGGLLKVDWEPTGNDMATASVKCPGSPGNPPPPPIPGQPGPGLTSAGPYGFTVPYAGGTQKMRAASPPAATAGRTTAR